MKSSFVWPGAPQAQATSAAGFFQSHRSRSADIGDASHIKFEVYETVGSLAVCDAENIKTQEFQSVTELNPSGVFTRLSDAVILANGDKYLNPELIT